MDYKAVPYFCHFPHTGPPWTSCAVFANPGHHYSQAETPVALPGTRGEVGASLFFLKQKNTTFFHLPAKPLEWVRTFHTSFPVLYTTSSPLWNSRCYNLASLLANLRSISLCTARIAVAWQRLWAPLRMRACVRCAATTANPAPRFYVNSFQNCLLASCG